MTAFLLLAWLAAADGGTPPPKLTAEEVEMIKHLELLQAFDEAKDLEMLEELSVER